VDGLRGQAVLKALARELREKRRRASEVEPARAARPATSVPAPWASREPPPSLASPVLLTPSRSAAVAEQLAVLRRAHPEWHERLARLDEAQQEAILSDDRAALVRAQVGSGKTSVLVHKVIHLHRVHGVPLGAIAVLTFTNRAADEIRVRIGQLAGRAFEPDDLWLVGTFHGVARTLLVRALAVERLGFERGFTVLDEPARDALLDELVRDHGLRVRHRRRLWQRVRGLGAGVDGTPDDLPRLLELFAEAKRGRGLMDFDDLIVHATALLGEPFVASAPHPPPRFVLVDELQDCEPRELDFLLRLLGSDARFFGVGDPHQAIYGWRGSGIDAFGRLEAELGGRTYTLPANYRSTRTILEGARRVLGPQPAAGGALVATRAAGEPIRVRRHHDAVSEAIYLAARVRRLREDGVSPREIAILCRLRTQVESLERVLVDQGIACVGTDDPDQDAVRLMTLHGAKGLEFRRVFLSGMNAGIMPLGRRGAADEAEERRLLFVGITRARDGVEISYHGRPEHHAAAGEASPYLRALPAAAVDWRETPAAPGEEGASSIASEAPAAPVPVAASPWGPGVAVRHPRYGAGRVVRVAEGAVECDFGKLGTRSFPLRLCPLTPLGT
jgi:superfamily I DNA/RNA helicase